MKKEQFKLRSQEQMKDELSQISGEQERLEWFGQAVKDFDKAEELNDLKHFRPNRRHGFDPHLLDQDCEEEISIPPKFKTLNNSDGWLDYIFSRSPDDLHELVEDEELSKALCGLNSKRREALFYRGVMDTRRRKSGRLGAFLTATCASYTRRQYRKYGNRLTNKKIVIKICGIHLQ